MQEIIEEMFSAVSEEEAKHLKEAQEVTQIQKELMLIIGSHINDVDHRSIIKGMAFVMATCLLQVPEESRKHIYERIESEVMRRLKHAEPN